MSGTDTAPRATTTPTSAPGALDTWATRLFIAYLLVALPIVLFGLGQYHWFFADEWEYLANRSVAPDDLFRHHYGHWVATPLLVFRGLYAVFGITSYLPYQAVLVGSHLLAAWLLFVVMRRSGARAWIAACVASPFVLFGPGAQNIVWAFQIAFTFALVLGLTQLLLAGHDGPIDRRDWLGLAAGAVALTCSGVAPALVVAVGVATFIRRGWRPAAFQTAPLAAMYLTWYVLAEPKTRGGAPTGQQLMQWVTDGEIAAFEGIGHFSAMAIGLAVMLVVGLALTWQAGDGATRRVRFAAPIGLLLGGLAFEVAAGAARASNFTGPGSESGRFVYVAAALALPALAVAAEAIVERWRLLGPVIAFPFLLAIVPNLDGFESPPFNEQFFDHRRDALITLAYSPYIDEVPEWVRTDPGIYRFMDMDVGFLRSARSDGRLPAAPDAPDQTLSGEMPIWLGLAQIAEPGPAAVTCTVHHEPFLIEPDVGDRLALGSSVNVVLRDDQGPIAGPVRFDPGDGAILEVTLPDLGLDFRPIQPQGAFRLCDLRSGG